MKTAVLLFLNLVSIVAFGQDADKLVAEISPLNASAQTHFFLNIQGKLSYSFTKNLSLSARHNQEVRDAFGSPKGINSKDGSRRNSFTELNLGITLYRSQKPRIDPTEAISPRTWFQKLLQLDLGMNYYKFAANRTNYYSYDINNQGNYKVINSINRLSTSLGFSYVLREIDIQDPNHVKLKRQHTFSAGAYYGISYDLQGYVKMPDENPSERAPKKYAFDRTGYYLRYNFRQQINRHLFAGADLFFSRLPHVEYKPNPDLFVFRGGEAELRFQAYAGITVGWTF